MIWSEIQGILVTLWVVAGTFATVIWQGEIGHKAKQQKALLEYEVGMKYWRRAAIKKLAREYLDSLGR